MRIHLKAAVISALCILSAGAAVAQSSAPPRLTIASGPVSGGWYPMAGVLGELIEKAYPDTNVTVTTGGGVENLPKVAGGLADVGFTQSDIYAASRSGTAPFEQKVPGVAALGYLGFVPQAFFLVKEGSDYTTIEDLVAKKKAIRLVVPPRNNGGELIVRRLFEQMGVTYDDIESWGGNIAFMGYSEASGLIGDGHADAYVGPVIGGIQELITQQKMRLMPWPEATIDAVLPAGYGKQTIPADKWYFVTQDVTVPVLKNILIVPEKMDPGFAGGLAKVLAIHPDEIRQSAAMFGSFSADNLPDVAGGPLHPGAEAYYRSMDSK
ncbi:TAXI family TRAP transporter solute-binding subunit [Amorphus sp. 3PC139-8]|uniref:TAXI family TRAP transporter solute-binding subunit n=1 Tax=Amorphus sp. 3PC139-8 TaxID=2735676 RepID=UPI00345D6A70